MDWKKLALRLLFPHPAVLAFFAATAAALLICCALTLPAAAPLSILSYALSFIALVLVCLRVPRIIAWVRRFRQENRCWLRYRTDVKLRMNISLWSAFAFNAVYAVFQLCLGLWHRSAFFGAMSGYYLLLAVMRLLLARNVRSRTPEDDKAAQWRLYRFCGLGLLAMTLTLSVFILYYFFNIRDFRHHEITVIAMAAYTFAALALAIVNVVRYRRYASPVYSAAKALSLASAAVSMLTLENAMLTAFGQETDELVRQILLSTGGAAVMVFVVTLSILMIRRGSRALRP